MVVRAYTTNQSCKLQISLLLPREQPGTVSGGLCNSVPIKLFSQNASSKLPSLQVPSIAMGPV